MIRLILLLLYQIQSKLVNNYLNNFSVLQIEKISNIENECRLDSTWSFITIYNLYYCHKRQT